MKKFFKLYVNWAGTQEVCSLGTAFYPISLFPNRVTSITAVKEGKEYKSISKTDYIVCFKDDNNVNSELIISGDIVMGVEEYEITPQK